MRRVLALVWKDIRLFASDRQAVVMSFVVPVLIASILAWLESSASDGTSAQPVPMMVVDQDGSAASKSLVDRLTRQKVVKPTDTDLSQAQGSVRNGSIAAAVVIPKDFGVEAAMSFSGGKKPTVTFLVDPSKRIESQIVKGAVVEQLAGAVAKGSFGALAGDGSPPFEVKDVNAWAARLNWGAAAHRYAGFGIQGLMFFAMEAAVMLSRERRLGIWKRLAAAPLSPAAMVLAKAISSFVLAFAILLAVMVVGAGLFGIRVLGSPLGFVAVAVSTAAMVSGFGLAMATIGQTESQARGLSILLILVMLATGGAWFPMEQMPNWVQSTANWLPVHWAVDGLDAVTWRGLGLADSARNALALMGFGAFFLCVAVLRFRSMARRPA